MPRKLPRYVQGFIDRNGHVRHYLRKKGSIRIPLPGLPWSREFMALYHDALLGLAMPELPELRTVVPAPSGSFSSALDAYYEEPRTKDRNVFARLSP